VTYKDENNTNSTPPPISTLDVNNSIILLE